MRTTCGILIAVQLVPVLTAAADDLVAKAAFVKGTEIYVTPGSDRARQITTDGIRKGYAVLLNDGRRIARPGDPTQ
jgi:hypothetical protein